MRKILVSVLAFSAVLTGSVAYADQWVNGHYRSNGTYVDGHYRSSPNQYKRDNYSTWGNRNPYTGQKGYKNKRACQNIIC